MLLCCGGNSTAIYTIQDTEKLQQYQNNEDDNEKRKLLSTDKDTRNDYKKTQTHSTISSKELDLPQFQRQSSIDSMHSTSTQRKRRFSISSESFLFNEDLDSDIITTNQEKSDKNEENSQQQQQQQHEIKIDNNEINNNSKYDETLSYEKMKRALNKTGFLSGLAETQLKDLLSRMKKIEINANTEIIKEGDLGNNFYIIESGIYEAWKKKCGLINDIDINDNENYNYSNIIENDYNETEEVFIKSATKTLCIDDDDDENEQELKLCTYKNEGAFGELTLMYNSPRAASIRSRTKGILWSIDRNTFRKVIVLSRIQQLQKFEIFLKSIKLFSHLNQQQKKNIADSMQLITFYKNEYIIKYGEKGDKFYMIVNGKVNVLNKNNHILSILNQNEYFGETALITNKPRNASVKCQSEIAEIAVMHHKDFIRLVDKTSLNLLKQKIMSYDNHHIN